MEVCHTTIIYADISIRIGILELEAILVRLVAILEVVGKGHIDIALTILPELGLSTRVLVYMVLILVKVGLTKEVID